MKKLFIGAAFLSLAIQLQPNLKAEPASSASKAPEGSGKPLFDPSAAGAEKRFNISGGKEAEAQVSLKPSSDPAKPGVEVSVAPGAAGFPGVQLHPETGETWDLSAYGHIDATITNLGDKEIGVSLRVGNRWTSANNFPCNCEGIGIKPGATETINVIFGHSYGHQPAYKLKPEAVTEVLLFTTKATAQKSFRIDSIVAAGPSGEKPPLKPNTVRLQPKNGLILGEGATSDVKIEVARDTKPWDEVRHGDPLPDVGLKFVSKDGSTGAMEGSVARLVFPAEKPEHTVSVGPGTGFWDMRNWTEVRLVVKNDGKTPVTPSFRLCSNGNPTQVTQTVVSSGPLAPGAEKEIVIPFAAAVPAVLYYPAKLYADSMEKGTGTRFVSDAAGPIVVTAKHNGEASLLIEKITGATQVAKLPDWLGKRPPVEGEWVKTFDDEFDGKTIDEKKWNVYGPNYWDKATHWSKDNVILGDGVVKLRYEKKTGNHNDDPNGKQSDYAAGFLETYGKWVQRYGYFEVRVKVPTAPGMWPAFWLMPDRGFEVGPQWKRQDTGNKGMEFDAMEMLTRWGPYRFNIANHWDGYGKEHMANGSTCTYLEHDKDGFFTIGVLWVPNLVVYYGNGKELMRWENPRVCTLPMDMMFTLPRGGWENNNVDDTQLPADFVIDYVRAWQRKDLASDVDGYKKPAPSPAPAPVASPATSGTSK